MRAEYFGLYEPLVGLAVSQGPLGGGSSAYTVDSVRGFIHRALLGAGLGRANPQAPMTDIIQPGATVLLKPNWVLHYNRNGGTMSCMVTQPAFIEATLEEVLLARPGRIIIGDAPIQLCDFSKLVLEGWRKSLQRRTTVPVDFIDFRRHIARSDALEEGVDGEVRSAERYVLFDLGRESLLEEVTQFSGRFRVTNYDPRALAETHQSGRHQYLLCREAFEVDVIISLPKLKTHGKAGITGALKNLVGMNGNKDYLPHHRVGGTALGGDCYAGFAPLKRLAEFCLDAANRGINTAAYGRWSRRAWRILDWHRRFGDGEIEGGWYGNDTTWRMVLDLNRLLLYGRADGTLSDAPLRRVYSLTDAIIAGQGDGPLSPEPLELRAVTFAASSVFADLVHAGLMGFDYRRLPIVREAFNRSRYPLAKGRPSQCVVNANGQEMTWEVAAERFGADATPAHGWIGHIERSRSVPVDD